MVVEIEERIKALEGVTERVIFLYNHEHYGSLVVNSNRWLLDLYRNLWGLDCAEESITRAGRALRKWHKDAGCVVFDCRLGGKRCYLRTPGIQIKNKVEEVAYHEFYGKR